MGRIEPDQTFVDLCRLMEKIVRKDGDVWVKDIEFKLWSVVSGDADIHGWDEADIVSLRDGSGLAQVWPYRGYVEMSFTPVPLAEWQELYQSWCAERRASLAKLRRSGFRLIHGGKK